MNKKKLFNILLFCAVFLWIIPSMIFYEVDKKIIVLYFGFHLIISFLYLIHFLNVIKNKRNMNYEVVLIYLSMVGSVVVHMATYAALFILGQENNIKLIPMVLALRVIIIIVIFISRQLSYEDAEIDKRIKEERKLNKGIKKEKKEKKSSKWIHKILLKDFKSNIKNYIVFIISAVLTVTYIYGFLGNLFIVHKMQQTSAAYITEGITSVVLNALFTIAIVTILIQFYALKNYVQNRMHDLKTLLLLGVKEKEIYKCMRFLLIISLLLSYIIGVILGNGMIFIFRKVYGFYLQSLSIPKVDLVTVTVISFIGCVLLLGFIMSIVQDLAIESSILNVSSSDMEEKLPNYKKILLILPIFLIILFKLYSDSHWAESKYIIYTWIIIFVVFIYFVAGYILNKIKSKKYYLKNILSFNLIFYQSRTYLKNSLLLYTLLFVMFFTYFFQISSLFPLETKEFYPYDYVCLGYEKDKGKLKTIEQEFDVKSRIYPVVRVTVPGGEDGGYGSLYKTLPMGHHLGISESTYKKLTGENLNLKNKDIVILYQEDKSNKAHPLDFYVTRSKPFIRIGQPERYTIFNRKVIFSSDYNIVKEKREIVFGRLTSVMYENIVVFSDEYFNNEHKNTDGIKYLMTIKDNGKNDKSLAEYMDNYKKTHNEEREIDSQVQSVYKSKDLNEDFQGDKIFKLIINISISLTFVIASIMIVFVHAFGNRSYYKNCYEILSYLGEKKKKSNSIIRKEIIVFAFLPCILAIFTSLIFIIITVYMRGFNYLEIISSGKVYTSIMLAFLAIYGVSTFIISHFLIKDIGGK